MCVSAHIIQRQAGIQPLNIRQIMSECQLASDEQQGIRWADELCLVVSDALSEKLNVVTSV